MRNSEDRSIVREMLGWLIYILIIIGLTYLIITFVGQRTRVSGSSMETTLSDGDNLIVDKISYRFRDPNSLKGQILIQALPIRSFLFRTPTVTARLS